MSSGRVIITCAVTGSVHTPSMSPHLPVTPEAIADQAIEAVEAGAAIVHLHTRSPDDGSPVQDAAIYRRIVSRIRDACDVIVNITTGGPVKGDGVAARMAPIVELAPEMCTLHLGSMNLGLFPLNKPGTAWTHAWEPEYLERTRHIPFVNTFADVEAMLDTVYTHGILPEFECFDVGQIYNLKHFVDRGLLRRRIFVQFVMGLLGGIGADTENLLFMRRVADKLFGTEYGFSVIGAGRWQMPLNAASAGMGGHVRVGLEDSLYIERGRLATSNAEQVRKVRGIIDGLSLAAATPGEARAMLGLAGG